MECELTNVVVERVQYNVSINQSMRSLCCLMRETGWQAQIDQAVDAKNVEPRCATTLTTLLATSCV